MANEPKTPGQVAWEAYRARTRDLYGEEGRRGISTGSREGWSAAASAVRLQLEAEQLAQESILDYDAALTAISRVRDIRAVLAEWGSNPAKVMSKWVYFSANDVIDAIEDLLASPKPEEAEVCAEDAGAERSKSPPPAKR